MLVTLLVIAAWVAVLIAACRYTWRSDRDDGSDHMRRHLRTKYPPDESGQPDHD